VSAELGGFAKAASSKRDGDSSPANTPLLEALQSLLSCPVRCGILGRELSTFCIGGPLEYLVTVNSVEELARVRRFARQEGLPIRILGNGSNLLIADSGLEGISVKLSGDLRRVQAISDSRFEVSAGCSLMSLARQLSKDGFSGLEFAAGIPASVGGAVFMNAGAHGGEIGERVEWVECVTAEGDLRRIAHAELEWRYRSSGLDPELFVMSVGVRLTPGDRDVIGSQLAHNLEERRRRQPLSQPSAGSVFKNPSLQDPAGRLLEQVGLKGARVGGAQVSTLHANWIVNPEKSASARDVQGLIELCQAKVFEATGQKLQPEVRMWLSVTG
jgi:UDP-N-acetylmuramate dehydrogenase